MNVETYKSGSGELGKVRIDYVFVWDSVSCEECRNGYTRTEREHLLLSKDGRSVELIKNLDSNFSGEKSALSKVPGYRSVLCHNPVANN